MPRRGWNGLIGAKRREERRERRLRRLDPGPILTRADWMRWLNLHPGAVAIHPWFTEVRWVNYVTTYDGTGLELRPFHPALESGHER